MAITIARPQPSQNAQPERSLQLALAAARTAADNRARDIVVLDVREQTSIFDYFVVCTSGSNRQSHAISEEIDRTLEQELGDHRLGIEGYQQGRWIVLDYGDVVVHIFDEEARGYYDLESLWSGARRIDLAGVIEEEFLPPRNPR